MTNTLVFNRNKLIDALKYGASCAGINKVLPITDYVHFKVSSGDTWMIIESNSVSLSAKTMIEAEQPAMVDIDVCVPADGLQKILPTLADYDIALSFGNDYLELIYKGGKAKFPTLSPEEYPKNFDTEKETMLCKCTMPSQSLKYILTSSRNFMGNDELRPAMMSVCLKFEEDGVEYCATDAHKMICEKIEAATSISKAKDDIETKLLIPKTAYRVLLGLTGDTEMPLEIRTYSQFASVTVGDKETCFTLLEGKYPNYRAVIPQDNESTKHLTVLKDELASSIKRMEVLADASTKSVVLNYDYNKAEIKISTENTDFGTGCTETIDVKEHTGDTQPLIIGFNGTFLNMCLEAIMSHNIVLNMQTGNKAVTFSEEGKPNKIVLLMPVVINA